MFIQKLAFFDERCQVSAFRHQLRALK
jgi:hypothetical protein